jgi:hypothetical protein
VPTKQLGARLPRRHLNPCQVKRYQRQHLHLHLHLRWCLYWYRHLGLALPRHHRRLLVL